MEEMHTHIYKNNTYFKSVVYVFRKNDNRHLTFIKLCATAFECTNSYYEFADHLLALVIVQLLSRLITSWEKQNGET